MAGRNGKPAAKRGRKKRATHTTPKKAPAASTAVTYPPTSHSDGDKAKALVKFREKGIVSRACEAAGIHRATWYRWMQEDAAFASLVAEAIEDVTDQFEEEAGKRALDESDTMLIFLLKARRRAIYGDRQTVTVMHSEVKLRVTKQAELIASQPTWVSEELLDRLGREVWTD